MKKNSVIFLALSLLVSLIDPSVQAAQETHGGNVVVCPGKDPVILDYYHASLPTLGGGNPDLIDLSGLSESEVVQLIRERLVSPVITQKFDEALAQNGPIENWIATDLRGVDDSAEPYILPPNCQRMTAAIRQGDDLYIDPGLYALLSSAQRGLLIVHEALYRLSGSSTSTPVRGLMRVILRKNVTLAETVNAIRLVGNFFVYEFSHTLYGAETPDGYCSIETFSSLGTIGKIHTLPHCSGWPEQLIRGYLHCSNVADECETSTGCKLSYSLTTLFLDCTGGRHLELERILD